ncbi:MAG: histidine phosphatase family protein [Gammaproteobacteria bacterium]|jgi:probable phosphoglycerate mutase|nr:histidine phosphatase family protein [Gammaproteobacteria bacterium]
MKTLRQKVVLVRHGETEWARDGRHTSFTDLPLTPHGRDQARLLRGTLKDWRFSKVLCSPLERARETCEMTGLADAMVLDADLAEWNYGRYEGLKLAEIQALDPHWDVFVSGCPGGESPAAVSERVDRVIRGIRAIDGDVAVFSHGHLLRVFATRWIGLPVEDGHLFVLDTATLNILGAYHDSAAIVTWNAEIGSG